MSCIEFDSLVVGSVEKKLGGVDFIKLFLCAMVLNLKNMWWFSVDNLVVDFEFKIRWVV